MKSNSIKSLSHPTTKQCCTATPPTLLSEPVDWKAVLPRDSLNSPPVLGVLIMSTYGSSGSQCTQAFILVHANLTISKEVLTISITLLTLSSVLTLTLSKFKLQDKPPQPKPTSCYLGGKNTECHVSCTSCHAHQWALRMNSKYPPTVPRFLLKELKVHTKYHWQ